MSFRPKERVISALRKLFHKTSTTNRKDGNSNNGATGNASKSPVRKSRRLVSLQHQIQFISLKQMIQLCFSMWISVEYRRVRAKNMPQNQMIKRFERSVLWKSWKRFNGHRNWRKVHLRYAILLMVFDVDENKRMADVFKSKFWI